jgi:dihydroneopterin aldolase
MTQSSVVSFDPVLTREADCIRVFLQDCTVELSVGHLPSERLKPQPIVISLEIEAPLPHHYQDLHENSLDRVIDYDNFYRYLREELPKLGHVTLLETLAEQIVNFCFEDRRIQKVRVRLAKPAMYAGTARAGIEMCRTRKGSAS